MKNSYVFNIAVAALDICVSILAFLVGYFVRNLLYINDVRPVFDFYWYTWILWVFVPTLFISLRYYGFYGIKKTHDARTIFINLLKAFFVCSIISAAAIFITKSDDFSRLYFVIFIIIDFILLLVQKLLIKSILNRIIEEKRSARRAVVVGGDNSPLVIDGVRNEEDVTVNIVGYVSLEGEGGLGNVNSLSDIIINNTVDEVIFIPPKGYLGDLECYIVMCEELGVTVRMVLDLYDLKLSKTNISYIGSLPMLTFHTICLNDGQLFIKKLIDIAGAAVGLLITAVLSVFIIPAIMLTSKGSAFYVQKRMGQNGRVFDLYKFRSMHSGAERELDDLREKNELSGAVFKMKDDPRVTGVGAFLRKFSLDELPQFYNVLKGDMSLVGTRPPTLYEVENYVNYHRRRLSIKPGITGLWQVSGRNEIKDFEEICKLDMEYIDNWSIALDIKIILKTFVVVFQKKGAL